MLRWEDGRLMMRARPRVPTAPPYWSPAAMALDAADGVAWAPLLLRVRVPTPPGEFVSSGKLGSPFVLVGLALAN